MRKGDAVGLGIVGTVLGVVALLIAYARPKNLSIDGIAIQNPETQMPAVRVEGIGVHSLIGEGPHTHGPMSAAQQAADAATHRQVEAEVFFKPGGFYTQADIDKNGHLSPAEKYRDFMSRHDLKPAVGDRICPITQTKANEQFSWWIGGKRYTFCCPPCIEELVLRAKKGEKLPDPETFVKR